MLDSTSGGIHVALRKVRCLANDVMQVTVELEISHHLVPIVGLVRGLNR